MNVVCVIVTSHPGGLRPALELAGKPGPGELLDRFLPKTPAASDTTPAGRPQKIIRARRQKS
jgi:hypothetical protein